MANLELALLLDLVCGAPTGRRLLPDAFAKYEQTDCGPDTIVMSGSQLDHLRVLYAQGDAALAVALRPLLEKAHSASRQPPPSVRDKGMRHSVGERNDYISLAKYWWPVSAEDGTVAYERRDGSVNPACFGTDYDYVRLTKMANETFVMAIASYFADDDDIGRAAARMISAWFLDPETAQTPHFSFAQIVPGKTGVTGRGTIEARYLIQVVDAVQILHHKGHIGDDQLQELRAWFTRLLDWMVESDIAKKAAQSSNNISIWYWTSSYDFARFVGDEARGHAILTSLAELVRSQVAEDGSLPAEMGRQRPHDYTAFSLLGLSLLEAAAAGRNVDILTIEAEAGRALTAARDWLRATEEAVSIRTSLTALSAEPDSAGSEALFGTLTLVGMLDATRQEWARDREFFQNSVAIAERDKQALQAAMSERENELTETRLTAEQLSAEVAKLSGETRALQAAMSEREKELTETRLTVEQLRAKVAKLDGKTRALNVVAKRTAGKLSRLKRQRNYLALPYVVLTAPVSVPLLLWNSKRRKGKRDGNAVLADVRGVEGDAANTVKGGAKNRHFSLSVKKQKPSKSAAEFYEPSPIDDLPDTYVLYRIIGNDLIPRHKAGQSRRNVKFILDHEAELENCEKRWIVNRIVDAEEEEKIVSLLGEHGQRYKVIPFSHDEYRGIPWDFSVFDQAYFFDSDGFRKLDQGQRVRATTAAYRLKNLYVMNNNGARNSALEEGRGVAKWILPWDGNCFLTPRAWSDLTLAVESEAKHRYFSVPMQRVTDNAVLLRDDFTPDPQEEPQLLFRTDAEERFNPSFPYGRRPKVELFWRLGIPGHWDTWRDDPWELVRREAGREAGLAGTAGWVARLASGVDELETQRDINSFKMRGRIRAAAIMSALDLVDSKMTGGAEFPFLYRRDALSTARQALAEDPSSAIGSLASELVVRAEAVVEEGVFSVIDKTTLPPSGDPHDYWHPAPYWWPNPKTADGLPYVRRDGQRAPGTRMYDPESEKYDRTRLQRMFDNTTLSALAAEISGREDFADHGAKLVRRWFLDPASRMNPNLNYAQVRMGHDGNLGNQAGVIEFKDIYYLLDAVRVLEHLGALDRSEIEAFSAWLEEYRKWLENSAQGRAEGASTNNHGTYFELQAISISAYLDDAESVRTCYFRALSRLHRQIDDSGKQPEELNRTLTQHYVVFNLQGFLNIFQVARAYGRPLLGAETCGKDRLAKALQWILSQDHDCWSFKQIEPFSKDRLFSLIHSAIALDVITEQDLPEKWQGHDFLTIRPIFDPHEAIHPFWNMGILNDA